jgi:hypothetical protein
MAEGGSEDSDRGPSPYCTARGYAALKRILGLVKQPEDTRSVPKDRESKEEDDTPSPALWMLLKTMEMIRSGSADPTMSIITDGLSVNPSKLSLICSRIVCGKT